MRAAAQDGGAEADKWTGPNLLETSATQPLVAITGTSTNPTSGRGTPARRRHRCRVPDDTPHCWANSSALRPDDTHAATNLPRSLRFV